MLHKDSSIPSGHCSMPSHRCRKGMHIGLELVILHDNCVSLQPVKKR